MRHHFLHGAILFRVCLSRLQRCPGAQPGGQHQADLRPGEDPGNGSQGADAGILFSPCRATAQGQSGQFGLRGNRAQITHQLRLFLDHAAVAGHGDVGERLHLFPPLRFRRPGGQQGGFQGGGHILRQVEHGHCRATVFEADHLTLLGDANAPGHRTRRLGQQRHAGGRATPGDGTTPAMEQGQWNLVLGKQSGEFFLGAVLGPGGTEKARILGGVGIADHHFLAPGHSLAIERHRQQGRHGVLGVVQVIQGFKQRHHAHGFADPGDLLQQHHRQHIRGGPGHGDHIGAQPFTALLGNHPAGGQHFCHLVAAFLTAVKTVINQRATGLQFLYQEGLLALLRPVRVAAQLQIAGHRIHRITMTGGFLANIQTEQGNAEAVEPAQGVFQVAIGDIAQPDCTQGAVDQLQGSQQLLAALEPLAFRHRQVFHPRFHLPAGQLQPLAHLAQNHPVGLVAGAGFCQQFLAGSFHGQVRQQVFHITQIQVSGHPAGQQQHFPGHRRGHVGVAVPVPAHPRGQSHRRPVRGWLGQPLLGQLPLQLPNHFRYRLPQGLLNGGEAPLGLVHRGGPFAADFIGAPGGQDQAVELFPAKGQFIVGEIRTVQFTEQIRHLVVLADQGTAGYFRGVGSEYQLH